MDDNSAKRAALVGMQDEPDNQKKCRGTFFSAEVESKVASIKQELFAQINDSVEIAKKKYPEIVRPLNEIIKSYTETSKEEGKNELEGWAEKIKSLVEFSGILKMVKPFCDLIEINILPPMRQALAKIRAACGCDFDNPETWAIAKLHTDKICALVRKLEEAEQVLRERRDDFYDQMQLFILIYQDAKEEHKANFFSKLSSHPERMAWLQPWLNIAEGREVSLEGALLESQRLLPEPQSLILRQGTIGI